MPKVTYNINQGLKQQNGSGFETSHCAALTGGAGDDIENDTTQVDLSASDSGKVFLCVMEDETKTITLPAGAPVGTLYRIVQNVAFTATKNIVIDTASTSDTFALGSFARCRGLAATQDIADGAADNRLTIASVATNNSWGIGSSIAIVKVSTTQWLIQAEGVILGSGKANAFTFAAQ